MESEEGVCELQRPPPLGRKILMYVTVAAAGGVCVFFFYAICLVLLG